MGAAVSITLGVLGVAIPALINLFTSPPEPHNDTISQLKQRIEEDRQTREEEDFRRRCEEEEAECERKRVEKEWKQRREEEERKRRQEEKEQRRRNEEEQRRRRREEEENKMREEELRSREGQAKRMEQEANRKAEEARRREEEANKNAEEAKRKEEEARKKEELLKEREKRVREEAQRREEETKKREAEAAGKAEDANKNAEEARRKEQEAKASEAEAKAREEQTRKDAELAQRLADEEKDALRQQVEETNYNLANGIQPIVLPTMEEFEAAKVRVQYNENLLHFAVSGPSGSGKSSLINAFRGLRKKDRGAAQVGVVETTTAVARYPDPRTEPPYPRFVWYDVPGAGTAKIPAWQYFNQQGLFIFDFIILVYDARFTKIDADILENCRRFQIPAFIVRSKANMHIQNVMDEEEMDYNEARDFFIKATRENLDDNLKDYGLWSDGTEGNTPPRVYIVSNVCMYDLVNNLGKNADKYIDEPQLLHDLLRTAYNRRYTKSSRPSRSTRGSTVQRGVAAATAAATAAISKFSITGSSSKTRPSSKTGPSSRTESTSMTRPSSRTESSSMTGPSSRTGPSRTGPSSRTEPSSMTEDWTLFEDESSSKTGHSS